MDLSPITGIRFIFKKTPKTDSDAETAHSITPTKPAEQLPVVSYSPIQTTLDVFNSMAKEKKQQTREKISPSKRVSKVKARFCHIQWVILCVTRAASTSYWLYFLYSLASVCEGHSQFENLNPQMLFITGLSPKPILLGCATVSSDLSASCQALTIFKSDRKVTIALTLSSSDGLRN